MKSSCAATIAFISLLASQAQASVAVSVTATATTEGIISPSLGTAINGALNSPIPTINPVYAALGLGLADRAAVAAPLQKRIAEGPEDLTIKVWNNHGDDITTSHARNAGSPTAVGGALGAGVIANGATASFAVPSGYAGNIAINDGNYELSDDDSLIEVSYVVADGYSFPIADVDISYVNGFSVAITCQCDDVYVVGCNTNLFATGITCADNDGENACVNPERASTTDTTAAPFFAPCAGAACEF
ncbi:hypothetical protein BD289DRAFT_493347, partial [Coniella lustricola]